MNNNIYPITVDIAVFGLMGYSYLYQPYSERDVESKVSLIHLRTAVMVSENVVFI